MSAASEPLYLVVAGFGGSALTAFVAWVQNRRRGDIDESAIVLTKWKELVEQHQADIRSIREEFANYKSTAMTEIAALRERLSAAELRIVDLEKDLATERERSAGLMRQIAQNSQSTAVMLGRSRQRATDGETRMSGMEDDIAKLDQTGHNSGGGE